MTEPPSVRFVPVRVSRTLPSAEPRTFWLPVDEPSSRFAPSKLALFTVLAIRPITLWKSLA